MRKYNPITHKNLDKLIKRLDKIEDVGKGKTAYITTKATSGNTRTKKRRKKSINRTARDNFTIFATQKINFNRDPVFFSDQQQYGIIKYFASVLGKAFGDPKRVDNVAVFEHIGKKMVQAIKRNIATQRSSQGRMPKLSPKYAAIKRQLFGFKPILVRTGTLRRSIINKVGDARGYVNKFFGRFK